MKFNKPFHIKLVPNYDIKEPMNYQDIEEYNERAKSLGGLNVLGGYPEEHEHILSSGGRMDWHLYNEPDSDKPVINISLMRIWALQLVTQMVNEKAYVHEIVSEPKFNINEEDKKVFIDVISKMTGVLHNELELSKDSMVLKKKNRVKMTE